MIVGVASQTPINYAAPLVVVRYPVEREGLRLGMFLEILAVRETWNRDIGSQEDDAPQRNPLRKYWKHQSRKRMPDCDDVIVDLLPSQGVTNDISPVRDPGIRVIHWQVGHHRTVTC